MNVIEIMLLPSRRYTFLNCSKGAVISAEHNATEIRVQFPIGYESYSKRVDFITSKGNPWTEKMYVPEFEEYSEDFDKNVFSFTLPNEVTIQGELKMQFVAYMPDDTLTIVPFDVIPIYIEYGLTNFKKNGRYNPDLLVLSYNKSTEALMYSEQAKSFSQGAEQKADEALSTANEALQTAESVAETANSAETTALDSKAVSAAAAHTADMAYTAAGNAILKSDDALAKSGEAKGISQIAAEKAESALLSKVDKVQGKGLSSNDYTNTEKQKLSEIEANAQVNVQSDWVEDNTESDAYVKNKPSSLPADGGNSDTVDGKHASDFATAEQGNKADNAVPNSRKINGKALNSDITLVPSDIGAATASQGAKADTALQFFTETDPTVPSWAKQINKPTYNPGEVGAEPADSIIVKDADYVHTDNNYTTAEKSKLEGIENGAEVNIQSDWNEQDENSDAFIINKPESLLANGGNADTIDGKHANDFATAEQGTKADNAVPNTRKINDKALSADLTLTPSDIGAATSEQGAKADTALQSFTETDPTVPAWAKQALKPGYAFNEISGILSGLQIPDDFINAGKNTNAVRNSDTGQWTVSAEIPLIYTCNGQTDNVEITNIVKDFYNSATLSDTANLKLTIVGKIGITNYKLFGDGSYADNYRTFELGVNGYTGNRKVIIDWGGAEIPELSFNDGTTWSRLILIVNCDVPLTMVNLNVKITRTSNGYVYCCKGNNFNLYDCDIHVYNTAQGVSSAIVGNEAYLQNCKFYNYGGAQYVNNTIDGDNAKIINCKFETIGRSVYPINSEGAFIQGCRITTEGTSTVQIECNSKNNCTFLNCTLVISGRGTLRCNSGTNCYFINCTLIAESSDLESSVSANQGSSCYFVNCTLSATSANWSSSGARGNSASSCLFIGCTLTAINNRANGYAYGANVWRGVMIGCDLSAYVPVGGTGQAAGFFLNSSATNNCIIIGCKFVNNPPSGYEQNSSIIVDGTDIGGRYMITNNFISGNIITHTSTGSNYVKEPNITGGTF